MNENELHERLIDYVEGSISPKQKIEIESLIQQSPKMQNELDLIQTALNELQNISDEEVPAQYFTNILPRLRERLDSRTVHLSMFMPGWSHLFSSSLAVSLIVFSIGIMYRSFQPEELHSPIYSMVNDMERTEINSIIDETTEFGSNSGIIRSIENFVGDISNAGIIESKLTEDLLVLDVTSYQSDHELLSDMGDKEIEQVLDRLDKPSVP
jgi:hypothetical protein